VSLGQLKKKVIREFAKSPAKTIILISLCPVALYFIVPLFLPKKSAINESQKVKVIAANLDSTSPLVASKATASASSNGPTWQQVNDWIRIDPRREVGAIGMTKRNPFVVSRGEIEEDVEEVEMPQIAVATPAISQEMFAALKLRLTGTLIGSHSRSATINGRRYRVGESVKARAIENNISEDDHRVVLRHVGARHVILEIEDARFRLELQSSPLRGQGITVMREANGESN